jgi:hypothetical protein
LALSPQFPFLSARFIFDLLSALCPMVNRKASTMRMCDIGLPKHIIPNF